MNVEERRTAFALAAAVVVLAAGALTLWRPGAPAGVKLRGGDRPASSTTPATAVGDAGSAPVPPGAWRAARAFARREAAVERVRVVSVEAADDPQTPQLEMAVTTAHGKRRTTLVLLLDADDGAWRVTASR